MSTRGKQKDIQSLSMLVWGCRDNIRGSECEKASMYGIVCIAEAEWPFVVILFPQFNVLTDEGFPPG